MLMPLRLVLPGKYRWLEASISEKILSGRVDVEKYVFFWGALMGRL